MDRYHTSIPSVDSLAFWYLHEAWGVIDSVDSTIPSVEETMPPSTPPTINNAQVTNASLGGSPGAGTGAEIQDTSSEPSFTFETSGINGSLVHRCECGKAIKRMSDLKRHWKSRRHGGRGFGCFTCRRSYARKYMLNQHVCRARPAGNVMEGRHSYVPMEGTDRS
ncbi:hypothetical protein F5887DRAFT_1074371 [Amanita rubescens]|nr:hypothetical protein F5887DRAFT_1074371 [Amanita rubescens]